MDYNWCAFTDKKYIFIYFISLSETMFGFLRVTFGPTRHILWIAVFTEYSESRLMLSPVNVITFGLAQSDHIKRLLLYFKRN